MLIYINCLRLVSWWVLDLGTPPFPFAPPSPPCLSLLSKRMIWITTTINTNWLQLTIIILTGMQLGIDKCNYCYENEVMMIFFWIDIEIMETRMNPLSGLCSWMLISPTKINWELVYKTMFINYYYQNDPFCCWNTITIFA